MNEEWSDLNKSMQESLKRKDTFREGIATLMILRNLLMNQMQEYRQFNDKDFSAVPYLNAKGYHSKTIAYSLWHIFRIEDIVAHSLIMNDEQILFRGNYKERIHSPIITTGNELVKLQIADFSSCLNLDELYRYIEEVKSSTEDMLERLTFEKLKIRFSDIDRDRLKELKIVSEDENAVWLIDYWCSKNIKGLIQMPFSRHWIMHVEACERIKTKL